jgi:hypothetical protein
MVKASANGLTVVEQQMSLQRRVVVATAAGLLSVSVSAVKSLDLEACDLPQLSRPHHTSASLQAVAAEAVVA